MKRYSMEQMDKALVEMNPDVYKMDDPHASYLLGEAHGALKFWGIHTMIDAQTLYVSSILIPEQLDVDKAVDVIEDYMDKIETYDLEDFPADCISRDYALFLKKIGGSGDDTLFDYYGSFVWDILDAIKNL